VEDVRGLITKALTSSSAADVTPLGECYKVLQHQLYVFAICVHVLLLGTISRCINLYAVLYLVEWQGDYEPGSTQKITVVAYLICRF
jgi:hypothetical protein